MRLCADARSKTCLSRCLTTILVSSLKLNKTASRKCSLWGKTLRNHTFVCSGPGTRASFSSAFANTGSRRERKLFVYFWASLVIPSYQQTVAMIASLCMIFHQHLLKYNGWLWFSIVVYRCVHVCHCASYCNISNIFKYVLQLYHGN